ncbi:hypothetical protein Bca101_042584 [Brassica carinata]
MRRPPAEGGALQDVIGEAQSSSEQPWEVSRAGGCALVRQVDLLSPCSSLADPGNSLVLNGGGAMASDGDEVSGASDVGEAGNRGEDGGVTGRDGGEIVGDRNSEEEAHDEAGESAMEPSCLRCRTMA